MKKLLIGSAIVFLTIFTAGLLSPALTAVASPPSLFPWISSSGTLWFVENSGAVTGDTTPAITLNLAPAVTNEPRDVAGDFFYGTLTYTDPVNGATTVTFSAIKGDAGIYYLNGVSNAATPADVRAELKFAARHNPGSHNHLQPALTISGSVLGGTALSFEGAFFK